MTSLTTDEIIEVICTTYDPELFVDVLEISTEQLCRAFRDTLEANIDKFKDAEEYWREYTYGYERDTDDE